MLLSSAIYSVHLLSYSEVSVRHCSDAAVHPLSQAGRRKWRDRSTEVTELCTAADDEDDDDMG